MAMEFNVREAVSPAVFNEFSKLPEEKRGQVVNYFGEKKKSVVMGYLFLCLIFGCHYGYIGKWGMQIAFWLTAAGIGIWGIIDIFRMKGIIQEANDKILLDIIAQSR